VPGLGAIPARCARLDRGRGVCYAYSDVRVRMAHVVTLLGTPIVAEKKRYKAPRVQRRDRLAKVAESGQPIVTGTLPN